MLKTSPEGREQVLCFLDAGDILNEIGVFAKRANPATAIALEEIPCLTQLLKSISQIQKQGLFFRQMVPNRNS